MPDNNIRPRTIIAPQPTQNAQTMPQTQLALIKGNAIDGEYLIQEAKKIAEALVVDKNKSGKDCKNKSQMRHFYDSFSELFYMLEKELDDEKRTKLFTENIFKVKLLTAKAEYQFSRGLVGSKFVTHIKSIIAYSNDIQSYMAAKYFLEAIYGFVGYERIKRGNDD